MQRYLVQEGNTIFSWQLIRCHVFHETFGLVLAPTPAKSSRGDAATGRRANIHLSLPLQLRGTRRVDAHTPLRWSYTGLGRGRGGICPMSSLPLSKPNLGLMQARQAWSHSMSRVGKASTRHPERCLEFPARETACPAPRTSVPPIARPPFSAAEPCSAAVLEMSAANSASPFVACLASLATMDVTYTHGSRKGP
jgi:hypothetical protein